MDIRKALSLPDLLDVRSIVCVQPHPDDNEVGAARREGPTNLNPLPPGSELQAAKGSGKTVAEASGTIVYSKAKPTSNVT